MQNLYNLIEKNGFSVTYDGNISYLQVKVAKIENDKSLTLFIKQNSEVAEKLKIPLLIQLLNNPVINNNMQQADYKRTTTITTYDSIITACQIKYGTLAKALEYAAYK